jgi:hypothetical protein
MNATLWLLLGLVSGAALALLAHWIDNRRHREPRAQRLGYCTTSRHGLALTSRRVPTSGLPGVVTRRFYGYREISRGEHERS